jgi:hypothetical protein
MVFTGLFEERAIVLGKLGLHERALAIYVSILRDVPHAIQYCDKVFYLLYPRTEMFLVPLFVKVHSTLILYLYCSTCIFTNAALEFYVVYCI